MAKKITIQHLYTTGTTAAPAASAITLGEIAISAGKGREGIYFKNNNNEVVKVPISTDVQNTITKLDGNGFAYKALSGESPKFHIGAGTGIEVTADAVGINSDYQTKIANGATAYSWGDHTKAGYAINTDLTTLRNSVTAHTSNGDIHVTAKDKNAWNQAKSDIDAFMAAAESGTTALDTLKEIQDFLTSDDGTVQTLLDNLSALTDTVSGNTDDITSLKQNFEGNGTVSVLQKEVQKKVETIDVSGNLSAVTGTTSIGNYKKYTITHTPASTQASAITAANNTANFSFGSNFSFVTRIGYDANGHVVSGSTQTLTLPELPTADADTAGIVKIQHGALGLEEELLPNPTGIAADVCHHHTQYVKYNDLTNYNGDGSLVISCGTY